jgi:molybdopterin synthase sulfur carrier subunit
MQLLYFGWVRTCIGTNREEVEPPADITDVRGLVTWLKARGGGYAEALEDIAEVRIAVNQVLTELDAPVARGDEVALVPPMTGG